MYFERVYDERLAQASYLIGCQATGTAIVIDPNRLTSRYLEAAAAQGLRITAITETHIHADFVSGARQLAAATGARLYVSGAGTPEWQYRFRSEPGVEVIVDGSRIQVGNVVITAAHTPGHTPEHLCFLVTDGAVASEPMGIATGDFVFVGDVGRPDLLEKAAGVSNAAEPAARQLFASLRWFLTLPDHLQVWPGHGAGSACGKGLGAMPQSTVGYERRFNWALGITDEAEFVRAVLAGQPEPPKYFGRMKKVNRDGPAVLGRLNAPGAASAPSLRDARERGEVLVDLRPAVAFAKGHIPGSLNVPLSKSFLTYAGSVVPFDEPLHLIVAERTDRAAKDVVEALATIGFERVESVSGAEVIAGWVERGEKLQTIGQVEPGALDGLRASGAVILDVRNGSEWDAGHLEDAVHIPLPQLGDRLSELPRDAEVVVHCQGGSRSAIAASVLKSAGFERVDNLVGGYGAILASKQRIRAAK